MLQLHSIEEFTAAGTPVTWLACTGTLSPDDSDRLRDQLWFQMRHGPRHLLLDLTDVDSADWSCVALLTDADRHARTVTCTLTVIIGDRRTVAGLDLDSLSGGLAVYPDLAQALAALEPTDNDLR